MNLLRLPYHLPRIPPLAGACSKQQLLSPPCGPATDSCNGLRRESNFPLAWFTPACNEPQPNHNPGEPDAFIALVRISGGRRPAFGRAVYPGAAYPGAASYLPVPGMTAI